MVPLLGHFAQEVGYAMEEEFTSLVEGLGYQVKRKRNPCPGIDLIADFRGKPIPETPNVSILQRPLFSPDGVTAFSIKRGGFKPKDVNELLEDIKEARSSNDALLRSIIGGVIVTNHTKTEGEIDKLLEGGVYCWDVRRLIFYAIKARLVREHAKIRPLREILLPKEFKGSYLLETNGVLEGATLSVYVIVFVDDHHIMLAHDHITDILTYIYKNSLDPIVRTTNFSVSAAVTIHVLGLANLQLAKRAYTDYAGSQSEHPRVSFLAASPFRVFQYGAAPWTPVLRL